MKKVLLITLLTLTCSFVSSRTTHAQAYSQSIAYTHPCTGEEEVFTVEGDIQSDGSYIFNINGHSRVFYDYNFDTYFEWAYGIIEDWAAGMGSCHGGGASTATQGLQTFQNSFSSYRVQPKAARPQAAEGDEEAESEGQGGNRQGLTMASSDVEIQSPYDIDTMESVGEAVTRVRAGISRSSADGINMYGTNAYLSSNGGGTILNAFYNRNSEKGQTGMHLNVVRSDFGNGVAAGAHSIRHGVLGGTFGLMTQLAYDEATQALSSYLNAAYLIGFPIGKRLALNFDFLVGGATYTVINGESVPFENQTFYLSQTVLLDVYMSDAFGFNIGYRNTQFGTYEQLTGGYRGPVFGGRFRF